MSSGHFIYMAQPTTEDTTLVVGIGARRRSWSMSGVRRAGLGGSNSDRSGASRHSGWDLDLAAEAAKGSPKRPEGTKRRRARGATHTVVRRTGAQKMMENVPYFEHSQKERFLNPNQGAPNVTHSEEF